MKYIIYLFVAAAMLLAACNSSHPDHEHPDGDGHDHSVEDGHDHEGEALEYGGHEDEIIFTHEQAEAVGLAVEEVVQGVFSHVIKTGGQIQSAQGDEATIVATSGGIVSFAASSMYEGAAIRAGETVVIISAKDMVDGDPAARARIEYETAEREYRRAEELIEDQIVSQRDLNEAQRRYELAKIAWEAQSPNVTADGVRVGSPIGGYIKNSLVDQGDYVSVGQPIATVSQNRRLLLRADVSASHFANLQGIGGANFQTPYDDRLYKISDMNGRLLSRGKAVDKGSFYIPVTFEFDNTGDIVPGSFVSVYLLSNPQENVISVPVSAVTEEQGLTFVYLRLDEEGYRKQEVTLGEDNGERVRIVSGLSPGQLVVTRGVYQVKLAAVSSVMPEGHSH